METPTADELAAAKHLVRSTEIDELYAHHHPRTVAEMIAETPSTVRMIDPWGDYLPTKKGH